MSRDKTMGFSLVDEFDLSYLPEPVDEPSMLALALMREGRALNHPAYAFLSFYRVLEVVIPHGKRRGARINNLIDAIKDRRAKEVLENLRLRA